MNGKLIVFLLATVGVTLVQVSFAMRVLLRPHREPTSRIAWLVVILAVPVVGIVAYTLFGEVNIGRRRIREMRRVLARMPRADAAPGLDAADLRPVIPAHHEHLFQLGRTINGFDPVGGNRAELLSDANATIDALVADIDAACDHVHLLFYIWLPDGNGLKVAAALKRAAARGVPCRAMADGLGSRLLIGTAHWAAMGEAGVELAVALPIGNPLLRAMHGRIDLRNHRKIAVIDGWITYCGSQNCADAEFRIKPRFAPWVDAMIRFEGPIARQNQHLFASDWMAQTGQDLDETLLQPARQAVPGLAAQVVGTGPTVRYAAMPEVFEALMYSARRELVITTPYYVPDEPMQAALCAAGRRGTATTLIVPERNDSWVVAAASRSYYADLLHAGVRIFEYAGGLLHAKTLILDGQIGLIGSANLDRRSFELNYENNILFYDPALAAAVRSRQATYLARSKEVTAQDVALWPGRRRAWNNAIAMMGPVL